MNIITKEIDNGNLIINTEFEKLLNQNGLDCFESLWQLSGESVKQKLVERGTERIMLKSDDGEVETYIKRYLPLPLKEYFKAITSLRPFFPSGALHEWEAVIAFHESGIDTMLPIAAGKDNSGRTAVLTLGIRDYTRASELFKSWNKQPAKRKERRQLIENIAKLAGTMHSCKFAHQDFYLVHLFVKDSYEVLPIDLQRVIFETQFRKRWRVKDLGQLLYSSFEFTSLTDRIYFWKKYTEIAGQAFYKDEGLVRAILKKAKSIHDRSKRKKE